MWSVLRIVLLIVALVVALPVVSLAAWIAYGLLVPTHSASTVIADVRTTVTLRFYHTWDSDNDDHGVYLHVTAPTGRLRIAMKNFDWVHWARTSLYLTPQREIVALGVMDDDYLITLDPLGCSPWVREPSADWTYLGAFDYDHRSSARDGNGLRFFSAAEQVECLPVGGGPVADYMVRKAARQDRCP
jgi:hypothetical protein